MLTLPLVSQEEDIDWRPTSVLILFFTVIQMVFSIYEVLALSVSGFSVQGSGFRVQDLQSLPCFLPHLVSSKHTKVVPSNAHASVLAISLTHLRCMAGHWREWRHLWRERSRC